MANIYWHSNAPWAPTGYGSQTDQATARIAADNHSVKIGAFYGLQGAPLNMGSIQVLPNIRDAYGNDMLSLYNQKFDFDLSIILADSWVFDAHILRSINNAFCWAPVDHLDAPAPVIEKLGSMRGAIAMSQHGRDALQRAGIDAMYVPHAVDSNVFAPVEQAVARKRLGIPDDKFVVGMVAANKGQPSRKAFDQQIRAFAQFKKAHPDAILFLHTSQYGHGGVNLPALCEMHGLGDQDVYWTHPLDFDLGTIGHAQMPTIYSAMNVLMSATMGEGFGVPIIEAQMCGTPVITTKATAMPELTKTGWTVGWIDKFLTGLNAYQVVPSVDEITEALDLAYQRRSDAELRIEARTNILAYDADLVYREHWKPALEQMLKTVKATTTADERKAKRDALRAKRDAEMAKAVGSDNA